jgi:hypothetical protein
MPNYICVTCGVQFATTPEPPQHCPICQDPRQYVNPKGQTWTTLEEIRQAHSNVFKCIWFDRVVVSEAKTAVARSADRYLQAISQGIS